MRTLVAFLLFAGALGVFAGRTTSFSCAPGWYLNTNANPRRCVICPKDSWCPGGTESASKWVTSGDPGIVACPNLMVTINPGANNRLMCVNQPGYSWIKPVGQADPSVAVCPENTFSTGLRKQPNCTACPSGMKTNNGLPVINFSPNAPNGYANTYNDSAGTTTRVSADACLVPPGWYYTSSNKVVRCPEGEYRAGYVAANATGANQCVRCPRGTTTFASASPEIKYCDVLVPGFYWIDSTKRPGFGTTPNGNPPQYTKICEQNFYCPGNYPSDSDGKTDCPRGLWTKNVRSTSSADCLVPPGYRLPATAGSNITKCQNNQGEYFPEWRRTTEADVDTCKTCGSGIMSDDNEPINQFALDSTGFAAAAPTFVYAPQTSASCYISQGQGMSTNMSDPTQFRATTCTGNTYGVAEKTYELRVNPCKDCPANTFTTGSGVCGNSDSYRAPGSGGFFDPRACCTRPGWGYDGVRAAVCAQGTYNPADSEPADKCRDCPPGTTTAPGNVTAAAVDNINDCSFTLPGFGVQDAANELNAGVIKQAGLRECDVGKFSIGGEALTTANCQPCPKKRTTRFSGATNGTTECDVCPAGMGTTNAAGTAGDCNNCNPGFFGDIGREGGDTECKQCPGNLVSSFNFYINGSANTLDVGVVSEAGAVSSQQCLLQFAAIETGNWTKIAYKVLAGNGLGFENRLAKTPVNPKEAGSGVFSWFNDDKAAEIGDTFTISPAPSPVTIVNCLTACNDEPTCAAVVLTMTNTTSNTLATTGTPCVFKRGVLSMPSTSPGTSDTTNRRTMVKYRTTPGAVRPF
ncbi:hypothetical protein OEZ86_010192 [Tetradesmus obliquus]|nr:hypothetical protein OEZ86_010192 [Tetradesmus obliquus]